MGYKHWVWKAACTECKDQVYWSSDQHPNSRYWTCQECETHNYVSDFDAWPGVPRTIYCGVDLYNLLKVYPTPPEHSDAAWALPYSVRSFVAQASDRFGGCRYTSRSKGWVMGEEVFSDICYPPDANWPKSPSCHMVAGWTIGEQTCPLWESVSQLCHTEPERKFLHSYLRLVKDRNFPMLIPQARIGIAERRRPDFVTYVPIHYWHYRWYAVELDAGHEGREEQDEARDLDLAYEGYEVISLKPEKAGYYEQAKQLVERVESDMASDPFKAAKEVNAQRA